MYELSIHRSHGEVYNCVNYNCANYPGCANKRGSNYPGSTVYLVFEKYDRMFTQPIERMRHVELSALRLLVSENENFRILHWKATKLG